MSLRLYCVFAGKDPNRGALVDYNKTALVAELGQEVKRLRLVPNKSDITFWKLHEPITPNEVRNGKIDVQDYSAIADLMENSSAVLDNDIKPEDACRIRVVIVVQNTPAEVVTPPTLLQEREHFINKNLPNYPAAISSDFVRHQLQYKNSFRCNRPLDPTNSLPTTLLHPIFGKFLDLYNTRNPTVEDYHLALELLTMSKIYDNDHSRACEFRSILCTYGFEVHSSYVGTGGHWSYGHSLFQNFPVVILGVKNEIGNFGPDPFLEVMHVYGTFLAQHYKHRSVLPCFQITLFGPCVAFSSVLFTDKVHSDILGPILPLSPHFTDKPMLEQTARMFGALKAALEDLKAYYLELISNSSMLDPGVDSFRPQFPYRDYYSSGPQQKRYFTYHEKQPDSKKWVFYATTLDNKEICLKFVRNYCSEAHAFCARQGHAPALLAYESLYGGWKMVVMDALDTANKYRQFAYDVVKNPQPLRNAVFTLIEGLHKDGYVHGDLRDTNFFVNNHSDHPMDFMLLDFDFAGKVGVAQYPMYINCKQLRRPEGVVGGGLMLPEHDIEMVDHLFARWK